MRVPVVTDVVSCTLNQGVLCIEHETPGGLCATDVKTPILLSMGNSEITALRLATFSGQLAAWKRIVWHMEEKPVISLDHTFIKNEAHICQFIKEDSNFQTEFVMELVSKGSEL